MRRCCRLSYRSTTASGADWTRDLRIYRLELCLKYCYFKFVVLCKRNYAISMIDERNYFFIILLWLWWSLMMRMIMIRWSWIIIIDDWLLSLWWLIIFSLLFIIITYWLWLSLVYCFRFFSFKKQTNKQTTTTTIHHHHHNIIEIEIQKNNSKFLVVFSRFFSFFF